MTCSFMRSAPIVCALVFGACRRTPSPAPDASASAVETALQGCPSSRPLDSLDIQEACVDGGDPDEDVDVAFEENAAKRYTPRRPLPESAYSSVIQIRPSNTGYVRIRSRLVFPSTDLRNVLGRAPSCTVLRAAGPMKNSTGSMGIGYSIRLVDPVGRSCQGFVSESVVWVRHQ